MKIGNFKDAPFQNLKETQKLTGLSRATLYQGAKSGEFPHIKSGTRILFNVPAIIDLLDRKSKGV